MKLFGYPGRNKKSVHHDSKFRRTKRGLRSVPRGHKSFNYLLKKRRDV